MFAAVLLWEARFSTQTCIKNEMLPDCVQRQPGMHLLCTWCRSMHAAPWHGIASEDNQQSQQHQLAADIASGWEPSVLYRSQGCLHAM